MEWLVVPSILAVLFAGWTVYQATRPEAWKRAAVKLGLSYSRAMEGNKALPDVSDTVSLLCHGVRTLTSVRFSSNAIGGTRGGRTLGACDVSVQVQPRDPKPLLLTIFFVRVERLPAFAVGIHTNANLAGQPPCLRTGFRRQYFVDGLSDFQAERLMTASLQDWFENYPGWSVASQGNGWVAIHRERVVAPKDLSRAVDTVVRIADLLQSLKS